ncbi:MAG TPA: acyl-CoA dehydratase activase-related protein, partial [Polyangia bacterium]|nr:acyl-CoA dehydratase activase-related protein [Polyangia bacterium]
MADKVSEFLIKARLSEGQVVVIGGVTHNRRMLGFLAESWSDLEFVVPQQAPYFEAFGAALLAAERGAPVPPPAALFRESGRLSFSTFPPLTDLGDRVSFLPPIRGEFDPRAEYILGVDGGSTTTKVALVDASTHRIVAEHYGRTHGDPVAALKLCLREVLGQLGGARPRITLAATTGSSRELLGVFLSTPAVYNEIIAHTVGTTWFAPQTDTIFEIGGQDAKYVSLNNSVPIDYAMNEACSAGTGSFLEESARGDLNIDSAADIGPIAMRATAPLKFGEHCSAFINSDIRKAIQQGATREDIVAGLAFSVVANYLNRVVGNRRIGDHIALQGGVAKNPAVPLAFARLTGKPLVVPPDPELLGCFGVALLAQRKQLEGALPPAEYDLAEIIGRTIEPRGTFTCKSCDNLCEIRRLEVAGRKYSFGGRCSKYTNARKNRAVREDIVDYTEVRSKMLFEDFAPDPASLRPRTDKVVGIPLAFSVHSLWPIYSWFFHQLGVKAVASDRIAPEGIAKLESNYCFPAEIAHGAIQDVLDQGVDYLFLPLFRDMPSTEAAPVHACLCPLVQGLPFFARQAFQLDDERVLRPLISLDAGLGGSRGEFERVAERLGFTAGEGGAAYDRGVAEYERFLAAYRELGEQVVSEIVSNPDRIYVALLGRPYNAFTRDANMGIPRKFLSNGVTVIPFDMIYRPDDDIFPNMYWYYGQQNMKAVSRIRGIQNLYPAWITNFSCAPDSFMLHYLRWMMGQRPYLVLEIDSHSADAGIDTRIEAFLDIVDSYRRAALPPGEPPRPRRYSIERKPEFLDIVDGITGERIDIRDPRVTLVWPSMGDLSTEVTAVAAGKAKVRSVHLPVPNVQTTQLARNVASGKECIPSLLVLGSILQFLAEHPPNRPGELLLFFVPSTLGPCRTGQYYVFYERLFQDLGYENVLMLVGDSSNSYREMGPTFNRDIWWALVLGDWF